MDVTLCGRSALQYYRLPPPARELIDDRVDRSWLLDAGRKGRPLEDYGFEYPVDVLVRDRNERGSYAFMRQHLWSGELPLGSVRRCGPYVSVATPEFTLLELSRRVSFVSLCMLCHEVCGKFALPRLQGDALNLVNRAREGAPATLEGWSLAPDAAAGGWSGLWQRPLLCEPGDLLAFAQANKDLRYGRKLLAAASTVHGTARSPFEVMAALRLGLPRRRGGEGFAVDLDRKIRLRGSARDLNDAETCFADLVITSSRGERELVVECQSKMIHADAVRRLGDFERQTALMAMGYEFLPLTYAQLIVPEKFHAFAKLVARKLGEPYREKTPFLLEEERKLERELFIDWDYLGR